MNKVGEQHHHAFSLSGVYFNYLSYHILYLLFHCFLLLFLLYFTDTVSASLTLAAAT